MTTAKATIVSAIITGVLAAIVQIIGFFANSQESKPTTVLNNFNTGFQGVINSLSVVQSPTSSQTNGVVPKTISLERKHLDAKDFPGGALGSLAQDTSLIDGATWKLEPAPGDRTIHIDFRVEAEASGEVTGRVTARLIDSSNQVVCTVGANSATSSRNGRVFWDACQVNNYVAPASTSTIFRAEVKSEGATPLRVTLKSVYARAY